MNANSPNPPVNEKGLLRFCWVVVLLSILFRVGLSFGPIDAPAWRQAEAAYMTLRLSEESPMKIFETKVPYRGNREVHLAEFPVYPASVALIYKLIGGESLFVARMVNLIYSLIGLAFLYGIIRRVYGAGLATMTCSVYACLPLGLFYSRAVHPDFTILTFCFGFLFFGMRFYEAGKWRDYTLSVAFCTVAFLMKAPYCFYLGLPLAAYALFHPPGRWRMKFITLGLIFVLPLIAASSYNHHRIELEAGEIESISYPMKWTADVAQEHFFGTLEDRLNVASWKLSLRRIYDFGTTPMGAWLFLLGLISPMVWGAKEKSLFTLAWAGGLCLYLLLVFKIIASTHDYYSLPFLPLLALFISGGVLFLLKGLPVTFRPWVGGGILVAVALSAGWSLNRSFYFDHDEEFLGAGAVLQEATEPEELVLALTQGRTTGYTDPRILYYGKRRGWSLKYDGLKQAYLDEYISQGLDRVALLVTKDFSHNPEDYSLLKRFPSQVFEVGQAVVIVYSITSND